MKFIFEPKENDIMHYASGTQKSGAKYISRKKVNGKWVYKYARNTKMGFKDGVSTGHTQSYIDTETDYKDEYFDIRRSNPNSSRGFINSFKNKNKIYDTKSAYNNIIRNRRESNKIEASKSYRSARALGAALGKVKKKKK